MSGSRREIGSVFGDPQREAVRRLGMVSVAASVAPAAFLVLMLLVAPVGSPIREARTLTISTIGALITLSVVVHLLLRSNKIPLRRRLDIGFGYEVVIVLLYATMRHSIPWMPGDGFREVSPTALIILIFAALIPNPPRRTLLASLAAALMEPVGLTISIVRGNPVPSVAQIIAICLAPLVVAVVAGAISRVVYGLAQTADAARHFGSYRLVEPLGKGGMGEVWRAEHDLLARPAAIKLVRAEGQRATELDLRRFEREAQATATLCSPHTIQVFDFGIADGGVFYYVMELLNGLDLERLVRESGPMPPARVVHVLRQACRSLEEAHRSGLVHRDIKPANILLTVYGCEPDFVKVLDFGLVKPIDSTDIGHVGVHATNANTIVGTPAYMAPEMILGGAVDARADLYALGCVAFWLLTGRQVFEGDNVVKYAVAHVHERPDPPSKHAPAAVPSGLDDLVLACLAKDPAHRPATAADLERALASLSVEPTWGETEAWAWWADRQSVLDRPRADVDPATAPTLHAALAVTVEATLASDQRPPSPRTLPSA
ncbi:MAG: serine/threonine-protein kinase [Polyangiaceae bacterium]